MPNSGLKCLRVVSVICYRWTVYYLVDILNSVDPKQRQPQRAVVPAHLHVTLLEQANSKSLSPHLSGYQALLGSFWWEGMYKDAVEYCRNCPQWTTVVGGERIARLPLQTHLVLWPFQIVGVNIMDLPTTESGNKHVLVFQNFLTKWNGLWCMPCLTKRPTE